jgi:hypothetical protein
MDTKVIKQESAINVSCGDWESNYDRTVSWDELKKSKVGDVFNAPMGVSVCGRGAYDESLLVVFKNDEGCAGLLATDCTTNSPNPESYKTSIIIWFEY